MSDGTVFIVQTDLPYGEPEKGYTLRLWVEMPGSPSVAQVMGRAVADGFIAGMHVDKRPGKADREPIAINLQHIVNIKPAGRG